MEDKWEHIENKSSMTIAEMQIETLSQEHPEYEFKTGKPAGEYDVGEYGHDWMVGIYRRER